MKHLCSFGAAVITVYGIVRGRGVHADTTTCSLKKDSSVVDSLHLIGSKKASDSLDTTSKKSTFKVDTLPNIEYDTLTIIDGVYVPYDEDDLPTDVITNSFIENLKDNHDKEEVKRNSKSK